MSQGWRAQVRECVYFIRCGPHIKIGTTRRGAEVRMATLQLPPDARVVAVIEDAGRLIEAELHRMFRASRVRGEWFASTPELEAVIRTFATT